MCATECDRLPKEVQDNGNTFLDSLYKPHALIENAPVFYYYCV